MSKIDKFTPFVMKKFIAPGILVINGRPSPCECEDSLLCSYCVQANLLAMEKHIEKDDDVVKSAVAFVRKNGVRKTARQLGEYETTVRRWISSKKIPMSFIEKIHALKKP